MTEKNLHVHIHNFSPILKKGMDNLIKRGVYRSKADLIRAGVRSIMEKHCPELLKVCDVEENKE